MITDVPDSEAFKQASLNLLNLAWKIAIDSMLSYEEGCDLLSWVFTTDEWPDAPADESRTDEIQSPLVPLSDEEQEQAQRAFWERSQPALENALALAQQAVEMALKGRIAAVSPFLLIARDARDYPSGSDRSDVPFSDFRTIDAADLVRVHNAVCAERLTDQFRTYWDKLRRRRNAFMHTASKSPQIIDAIDILEAVIHLNSTLFPDRGWIKTRLDHVRRDEFDALHQRNPGYSYGAVMREFDTALRNISPAQAKAAFGYNTRQRHYVCPRCYRRSDDVWWQDDTWEFAQLRPRAKNSVHLFCTFCEEIIPVYRVGCDTERYDCKSNVLSNDDETRGMCLLCLHRNSGLDSA